jgi:hypothetical protein
MAYPYGRGWVWLFALAFPRAMPRGARIALPFGLTAPIAFRPWLALRIGAIAVAVRKSLVNRTPIARWRRLVVLVT